MYNIHDHHTPPVLLPRTTIFLLSKTENIHLAKLTWPRIPSMGPVCTCGTQQTHDIKNTIEVDFSSLG